MNVSVYLNEDDNIWHERRFVPETAVLRLAAQFRVEHHGTTYSAPIPLLENVFEQLNVGGDLVPAEPWTLRYRLARNRGLSVGDVVVVDASAYTVARYSWDPITPDQLLAGAERFAIANPHTPAAGALAAIQLDQSTTTTTSSPSPIPQPNARGEWGLGRGTAGPTTGPGGA